MSKVTGAKAFAIEAHKDQKYGDFPYQYHLQAVEAVLAEFGYTDEFWVICAWLHDVIEDTGTSYFDLEKLFGVEIAITVWSVTGIGVNREQCQANIRTKLYKNQKAALLKTADRIANITQCLKEKNKDKFQMYLKEHHDFIKTIDYQVPNGMVLTLIGLMAEVVTKGLG